MGYEKVKHPNIIPIVFVNHKFANFARLSLSVQNDIILTLLREKLCLQMKASRFNERKERKLIEKEFR